MTQALTRKYVLVRVFLFIAVVVHQQYTFELVVNSEISLGHAVRLQKLLLGVRQVLGLTQLEVVEPGFSN